MNTKKIYFILLLLIFQIYFEVTINSQDVNDISYSFDPNGFNIYNYDLYFIDNEMLLNNRKYFLNLKDYLPKEHIDMYNSNILPISNNKLYGLLSLKDKKIIIFKYLDNNNSNNNNNNKIVISNLIDNVKSSFPDLNTNNTEEALNKIKEIKEIISSDEIFKLDEFKSFLNVERENYVFYKNYFMPLLNETFHYDILPGNKSELYGVIPTNFNIAICKYISKERKENAIKVLKILTSKEMQKHIMLSYDKYESYDLIKVISGISSLYDDNDVCEKVDCNFIKRLRFTTMPVFKEDKYYLWSKYFRNKIYEFLYGNGTLNNQTTN
ncbi:hypothetical protein LY90DRAFT_498917 [Neocallimastix californiae]|uniref:Uncharacterized protein n=1 Tax=Neocallimastix californiae TaxID=1754190 RepID=A0A1Y2FQE0_9FUNG|nr:hypothetical protein LY90DRAFT_498917 [Neocallimastix californiae]|eukprot:ORY85817.1 hypothetical protein LY90DRAFT_498917 [Neocallimastix californiae]